MKIGAIIFRVILLLSSVASAIAQTAVFTISPSNSKSVTLGYHDYNNGQANNYATDQQVKAFCIPGAGGTQMNACRGLLMFKLTELPPELTIRKATLVLDGMGYINSIITGPFGNNSCYIKRVTTPWNETQVTWNTQPLTTTVGAASLPIVTTEKVHSIDVTDIIKYQYLNPSQNYGMLLGLNIENPNTPAAVYFYSEDGVASRAPKLLVEYDVAPLCDLIQAGITAPLKGCVQEQLSIKNTTTSTSGTIKSAVWKFGDGTTYTSFNGTISDTSYKYSRPGTYKIALFVEDLNGCKDTAYSQITIHKIPTVELKITSPICEGQTVSLASVTEADSYLWSGKNGFTSTSNQVNLPNITLLDTGTYTLHATIQGCTGKKSTSLAVLPKPSKPNLSGPTEGCAKDQLVYSISNHHSSNIRYEWLIDDVPYTSGTQQEIRPLLSVGSHKISAFISDGVCSSESSDVQSIVRDAQLVANISDTLIQAGTDVKLQASSSNPNTITWTRNNISVPLVNTSWKDKPTEVTEYTVSAKDGACTSSVKLKVYIERDLIIYNVFTPNQDGQDKNEHWVIDNIEYYPNAEIVVFNRWGEMVFQDVTGYKTPWNGTKNNLQLPTGVYYYVIHDHGSNPKTFSGSISIVR